VTDDLLGDRYGRDRRPKWLFPIVAVILIGIGVAWSVWAALAQVDKPISAQLYGYDVTSDHQIGMTVEVHRTDGGKAVCSVYAQGLDHSIVGERDVEIPESDEKTVLVKTTVETERRAVTGVLKGCALRP